ncbi:MAG TPA: histidine phosphatase family protein [Pseudosphingobacterium sp.]|nr:histidine phosphatase family protein [Pseudosphingobacterium sp.]
MLNIYLLRHGETVYNADGNRYCGQSDIGLTEKGLRQAQEIGQSLKSVHFNAIYSSPLERAYTTARYASHNTNTVIKDDRLMEMDFGAWEGKTREEFIAEAPALWERWDQAPDVNRAGGTGNTATEIVERVDNFFTDVSARHPQGNVLVVAHNTVNRLYLAYKLGMPLRNYRRIVQENSAITLFTLDKFGVLSLLKLNTH